MWIKTVKNVLLFLDPWELVRTPRVSKARVQETPLIYFLFRSLHSMKVFKKRLTKDLNLHKHFFSQKVVDNWNSPHNQCQDSQPIQDQLRQLPERKWIWGFRRHFKPTLIPSNLKCKCKCNRQIQCSIPVLTSKKVTSKKKEKQEKS